MRNQHGEEETIYYCSFDGRFVKTSRQNREQPEASGFITEWGMIYRWRKSWVFYDADHPHLVGDKLRRRFSHDERHLSATKPELEADYIFDSAEAFDTRILELFGTQFDLPKWHDYPFEGNPIDENSPAGSWKTTRLLDDIAAEIGELKMVNSYVILAEGPNGNGGYSSRMIYKENPEQSWTMTLGLLEAAAAIVRQKIVEET